MLALLIARAKTSHPALNEKAANRRLVAVLRFRPHDRDVGARTVRDPHFRTGEYPRTAFEPGAREHAGWIGSVVGFGQTETTDLLALGKRRQPAATLLFAAERIDWVHHERTLHACERTETRITALELLHAQAVRDIVEPCAAVFFR